MGTPGLAIRKNSHWPGKLNGLECEASIKMLNEKMGVLKSAQQ